MTEGSTATRNFIDDQVLLAEVEDLSIQFGEGPEAVRVVSDVHFELRRGEILCLLGESG